MTNKDIYATLATWILTISGWAIKILPVLQFVSFTLASVVSVITIYKFLRKPNYDKVRKKI